MKNLFLTLLTTITLLAFSQKTTKTLDYDGVTRDYIEYVPAIYDASEAVPLVICLHGLGDTMENFYDIGMNYVADTANFITLTPEALEGFVYGSSVGNAWNSGASAYGQVINEDIDDVGFIMQLIEETKILYNIDETRVFITGFSMGGFMSNRMACEMSGTFTAIASVSGTIGTGVSCNPEFPIPVCHIHGTNDGTVAYTGNSYGNDAEDLVEYWRNFNNCDLTPTVTNLPDLAADERTVDYYYYGNGDNNTTVEFYKVNNGEHDWMYLPNYDISYTLEIWKFFRKHSNLSVAVPELAPENKIEIYPNPAKNFIVIASEAWQSQANTVELYNLQGQLLKQIVISNKAETSLKIIIRDLEKGIYFVKIGTDIQKLIKE